MAVRIIRLKKKKKTVRLRGKECCDPLVMSAMDLGRSMVSCMLYIFQPGLNSTRWESNLTELPQTLCTCESAMPLNIHNASFAMEITCCSTSWRRQWHPTPVLLPGKSHGWRSLVGCSPWGHYKSDTTERLHFHFHAVEEEMATHSSVLVWRIPGTGEPGGLPSMGSHRVGHD